MPAPDGPQHVGRDLRRPRVRKLKVCGRGNDCATNTTVPVAAGAHTVTFSSGAAATTHWNNTTLEAVYIPFNGTGG